MKYRDALCAESCVGETPALVLRGGVKIIRQSGIHSRNSGRKAYGLQDNRDFLFPHL